MALGLSLALALKRLIGFEMSQVKRNLVIFGAGGHAVSVASVAMSAGFHIECFIDETRGGQQLLGARIVSHITDLVDTSVYFYSVAIGDNSVRQKVSENAMSQLRGCEFPPLVHKSAIVASFASVGRGTVIMPNSVVGANTRIGRFCVINSSSSVDHDSYMADYSSIAPGVVTGGRVRIGCRSAVSIGAVIKQGVNIGSDCVVGANSYLNGDLVDNKVAYGSPARVVRSRMIGDDYLS